MIDRALGMRLLAVSLIVAAAGLCWIYRDSFQPAHLQAMLADNPWAPLIFILVHIVASLVFIPRSIISVAAGLIFGLWWGIVLSTAGAMAGSLAGFFLARQLGGTSFGRDGKRWLNWVTRLQERLERGGWRAVALVRLMPIMPHTPVNYAFGLTRISLSAYIAGSFVGLLPSTVLTVDIGAAGGQVLSGSWNWVTPTLIGVAALAASFLLPKLKA
ncbi:MAG TPA: TVP38/TMEM64 family protein [Aliidongia sp.]|nr:TVP38/TMEM64 family protein [Aliidongia sp.]